MKRLASEEELNEFLFSFTNYGFIGGNHIVQWNQTFATEDRERFIRVIKTVVGQALSSDLPTDFNSLLLFYNKGDFDLYLRTVNAYTAWFFNTINILLKVPFSQDQ
ncbi:hypothetical protein GCM10028803_51170 [Larkinella knui]|uniref:Uncharacterized protein n=1 Tax=Larkinella knui TaxID=2025310 RepID=A0A3P1CH33_9BACT|nr:hypothetical protein [Larkinella knui]RRB12663.1 hypothetical protein EHT87_20975 [Larkinella knui]